ncbi:MAG: hypothetical protein JKY88_06830 [Pseudomonadales bacterium]|nr:hypothetical protein [Pseudomonadales bacterium]
MSGQDKIQDKKGHVDGALSLALARELRQLNPEMEPSRDLWPAIERGMAQYVQPTKKRLNWMPYSVAASLLIAVSALVSNVVLMKQQTAPVLVQGTDIFSLDENQVEYLKVRNTLKDQFMETNRMLPLATLDDLNHNIQILEDARIEIESQVRANPQDARLIELLMRIHAQEIELLKQDYSKSGQFM